MCAAAAAGIIHKPAVKPQSIEFHIEKSQHHEPYYKVYKDEACITQAWKSAGVEMYLTFIDDPIFSVHIFMDITKKCSWGGTIDDDAGIKLLEIEI